MVWYCDNCGEKILTESEGWVEWKNKKNSNNDFKRYDLRLVHHKVGCRYNQRELFKSEGVTISDVPLESYLGNDGLMSLLQEVSDNSFEDIEEVLEMIKRLHILGYEDVRLFISEAYSDGVFDSNMKRKYVTQEQIKLIQNWKAQTR